MNLFAFLHQGLLMALQNFVILLIFESYVIKLKQNNCFADWIQFRKYFSPQFLLTCNSLRFNILQGH